MKKKRKVEMGQQSSVLDKILVQSIDYLLKNQYCFVAYKFPFEDDIYVIVDSLEEKTEDFILHSFDGKQSVHIKGRVYLNEDIAEVLQLKNNSPLTTLAKDQGHYMSQHDYEYYVQDIRNRIKRGEISKCVAARKKKIKLPKEFKAAHVFNDMRIRYSNAFTYLANTSLGLWMGATPELLLSKKDNQYFTVALAGTKLVKEKRPWTNKEKDEHQIVVSYITDTIENEGFKVHETSPVLDAQSNHLVHLKKHINFFADRSIHQALHPTPAVCGIPLDKAKELIFLHEKDSRSLYSGYLGIQGEQASYYVNLRCMQIFDDYASIYVGAGITAESDPEKEWLETEAKAQVMKNIISI